MIPLGILASSIRTVLPDELLAPTDLVASLMEPTLPDPYWDSVMALLHFDGDLQDESKVTSLVPVGSPESVAAVFGEGISTNWSNNSYIQGSSVGAWDLSDENFTIEGFVRLDSMHDSTRGLISGGYRQPENERTWALYVVSGNSLRFIASRNGVTASPLTDWVQLDTTGPLITNEFYHVAVVRHGTTLQLFVNGALEATANFTHPIRNAAVPPVIGAFYPNDSMVANATFDELRITKGIARYTENFTPPTEPFPNFGPEPTAILAWTDLNTDETGHRIYRSSSPMDTQAMPPPVADLGPDVTEWEDTDTPVDQETYYIVSAVRDAEEAFSDEVMIDTTPVVVWSPSEIFEGGVDGAWYEHGRSEIYQDVTSTTPSVEYGDPIRIVKDLSPNGNDAVASGDSSRAILKTGIGGNGTSTGLLGGTYGNPTAFVHSFAIKTPSNGSRMVLTGLQQNTSSGRYNFGHVEHESNGPEFFIKYSDGSSGYTELPGFPKHGDCAVVTTLFTNGAVEVRVDGNTVLSQSGPSGNLGGISNRHILFMDITDIRHSDHEVYGEVLALNSLDSQTLNSLENYLYDLVKEVSPFTVNAGVAETTLSVPYVQGVEVSGEFAWVTSSSEATTLRKYLISNWSVVESATFDELTPGFSPTSFGDPTLYDGILYIPCGTYTTGGYAYVIEVDPDTLTYITHHDLTEFCGMGLNAIVRHGDLWYVGETAGNDITARPSLRIFNSDFTYVGNAWQSTDKIRIDFNGTTKIGDAPVIAVATHMDDIRIFTLDEGGAVLADSMPLSLGDTQGLSYREGSLYVAHRKSGQRIRKYNLTMRSGI